MKKNKKASSKNSIEYAWRIVLYKQQIKKTGFEKISHAYFDDKKIIRPPGDKLFNILEFLYTKKNFERIFEPMIADMQEEYFEALSAKRIWKTRWIHLRGIISLLVAITYHPTVSLMKRISHYWKPN